MGTCREGEEADEPDDVLSTIAVQTDSIMTAEDQMAFERLRTTIEPIIRRMDSGVDFDIAQVSSQRARHMYGIHLSKWGFTASVEIPFEWMMEGSAEKRQFLERLEAAVEDLRRQSELEVAGDIGMLIPVMNDLARQLGLVALSHGFGPIRPVRWMVFTIAEAPGSGSWQNIGVVDVRELPSQRVLLTFKRVTEDVQPRREQRTRFRRFQ